jgi:DNA-binding transcriptional ArsR family regulator
MENLPITDLAQIFSALGGETRVQLLLALQHKALSCSNPATCELSERCCDVSELTQVTGLAISTISYHLKELRRAGLIQTHRRGKHIYCSINETTAAQLAQFFESLRLDHQSTRMED